MDDFPGLLARDFGFKPQGKSAPMAPPRSSSSSSASSGLGSGVRSSNSYFSSKSPAPIFDDHDHGRDDLMFNDVFGGPPKYSELPSRTGPASSFDYDSIFQDQNAKSSSGPVFDKPLYDDEESDIFDGLPGVKSASAGPAPAQFDDVFAWIGSSPNRKAQNSSSSSGPSPLDDLLGNLGKKETVEQTKRPSSSSRADSPAAFDDLIPGFGRSSSPSASRSTSESSQSRKPSSDVGRTGSPAREEPFVVLPSASAAPTSKSGLFTDPLEEIGKFGGTGRTNVENSYVNKGIFDDLDPVENLGRSVPPISPDIKERGIDRSPLRSASTFDTYSSTSKETIDKYPLDNTEGHSQRKVPVSDIQESGEPVFDVPTASTDFRKYTGKSASSPSYMGASGHERNFTPRSEGVSESDDIWLTVTEIPLFTQPTSAPPPARPPPPRPPRISKSETGSFSSPNPRRKVHDYGPFSNSSAYSQDISSAHTEMNSAPSQLDEFEDFAMGRTHDSVGDHADVFFDDDVDTSSAAASAAAMKDAMDKAEAKFRQMRERENLKASRSKEAGQLDKDIQETQQRELRERQERIDRERQQKEREEEEREQRRLEKEREREEKEREQRRLEREREKARQAVERATREARERAATEARLKAERVAVEKAAAEARERAGRAAVQRAQAEARERAAAEAKERAERAAAEARERANSEAVEKAAAAKAAEADARRRSERAAVERAAAEARQRAAAEALERAAAAARAQQRRDNQPKDENDLESFFSSRPSSAPRPRASSADPFFDSVKKGPEAPGRSSVGSANNLRKASSSTNFVDDLSSIFGGATQAGEFQEVEGETEERRKARLERHQRTQERAAKALAEKNQRDLQLQREQAERHRIAETLDVEIKRWAAGKEGNLRALLSTLQYVLWPECGWQPVSLTDLITAASVKKVYRKATLCIHPDKVQQKGATLQQKYVAEKVFDLLKEAWNKFNSEELF